MGSGESFGLALKVNEGIERFGRCAATIEIPTTSNNKGSNWRLLLTKLNSVKVLLVIYLRSLNPDRSEEIAAPRGYTATALSLSASSGRKMLT
jgi:hypothetical protein